jgi:hypothetical protein
MGFVVSTVVADVVDVEELESPTLRTSSESSTS